MAEPIIEISPTGEVCEYAPFTLEELFTFDQDEIIARGREYFGADWTPSCLREQQQQGIAHA